jgi:hypothetical protein
MFKTRRLLALAFVTAMIGGGGAAWAAASGNGSESQTPAKAKISNHSQQRSTQNRVQRSQSHECPNSGSNSTSNVAFDL